MQDYLLQVLLNLSSVPIDCKNVLSCSTVIQLKTILIVWCERILKLLVLFACIYFCWSDDIGTPHAAVENFCHLSKCCGVGISHIKSIYIIWKVSDIKHCGPENEPNIQLMMCICWTNKSPLIASEYLAHLLEFSDTSDK